MTSELAVKELDMFDQLDVYSPTGVFQEAPRVDAIATVSAGYKNEKGNPVVSRDGAIYLSDPEGRAPGLAKVLQGNNKSLTICFPFDDPSQFIQQRFVRYSASSLEVHGDQYGLTEIKDGVRSYHEAGTPEYETLKATCKTSVSVYFCLFEWVDGRPRILWPDGPGFYRLRFTSRGSLSNLMSTLKMVYGLTGGRLGGAPFVLRLVYRDTADPKGKRRNVPLWTITMRHPENKALTSDDFVGLIKSGAQELEGMRLPPPRAETLEAFAAELEPDLDTVTLDADDIRRLENGIDPGHRRRQWFGAVRHTYLDDDDARAEFLAERAQGMSSLNDAIKYLGQPEWDAVLEAVTVTVRERENARLATEHEERNTDPESYAEGVTERHVAFLNTQLKRTGVRDADRFHFLSWLLSAELRRNADLTQDHFEGLKWLFGETVEDKYQPITDGKLADMMHGYLEYGRSAESAQNVLG